MRRWGGVGLGLCELCVWEILEEWMESWTVDEDSNA